MEQDKNKAPVDREEKPKAKRGTCRKPAAKKKAEKPAADTDAPAKESPEAPAPEAPEPAQTDTTNVPAAETAEPAQAKADDTDKTPDTATAEADDTDKTPDTATAEAEGADQMPDAAPADTADTAAEASDPAALDKCAFNESPDKDTPEQRERTASISRTAQLSIAQIMAGLEDNPQPAPALPAGADTDSLPADTGDTDDAEDEPEDTISQKLRRGAFGMAKWLLLVVLFILIIAGGGVAWLYRSATPDMLPEIKVTFDGTELAPTAYRWHVPVVGKLFRRTYAETLSSAPLELAEPVSGASPDLLVTPSSGYTAELTVTDADKEEVYSGSATGFRSFRFSANGSYDAKLVVTAQEGADNTSITGSETWQFRFTVSLQPTIQLVTDSVQQGSVAAIRVGPTLGSDAPTLKTTLENAGFVKAANGWICYLPIPWNEETGGKTVTVTADGYSKDLTLTVRAATYDYKDYGSKSQMVSPYIGKEDAPAAVKKLLSTSELDIQWSVGGFVQPFLGSFSTPLTYGMTEYAGRSYSERSTNYGYGGRTATNVVIQPKKRNDSMIVPASGKVLLAEDLGGVYGCTVVIDHGAGLKSIFYGLTNLEVKAGEKVKQGQLLGVCGKTVVAELRLGTVPIDPLAVWRGQCDALKIY